MYENALCVELKDANLSFRQQAPIPISYRQTVVGDYVADIVVEDWVIVELKVVREFDKIHEAQLLIYLRGSEIGRGLPLNFGKTRLGFKRMVLTQECRRLQGVDA